MWTGSRIDPLKFSTRVLTPPPTQESLRLKYTLPSLQLGFPGGSAGKESACNVGDLGSIPGLGRSPGEGKGYPLQYSGLGIPYSSWGSKEPDATFTFTPYFSLGEDS